MSGNSKEQEQSNLHKAIWDIANELRGAVDGWEFKQYILGFLFYRFISEKLTSYLKEKQDVDYAGMTDDEASVGREDIIKMKGFYMPPSELFENVRKNAPNNSNLNMTLDKVFKNIEASALGTPSEKDLKGLFDDLDVNSNKLGSTVAKRNEKLVKLLNAIGSLNLGNYRDATIDIFGDAYEYLMMMYAANAGKSGGEFFTPQEVSELLARITVIGKDKINKVYDPACGSGSLLLKFAKVLDKEKILQGFYGQEINHTTYNLCRINMFLHDINYEKFDIELGDTLTEPQHWDDQPFDAIVSNPPYSVKWKGDDDPTLINDPRFSPAGVLAPKQYADLAFVMHILHWLSLTGTAAIVSFPGIMYREKAEKKIRQYLVDNNFIDAVIQLPEDLFFGTGISTCILVLKKTKTDDKILFIDATNEFVRGSAKNKLEEVHMNKILDCYESRTEIDHFSRLVGRDEVADGDYNTSVSFHVEPKDMREIIDIKVLNREIKETVEYQNSLRTEIDAIVAELEGEDS